MPDVNLSHFVNGESAKAIKTYVEGVMGSYTLPEASAETLGGVKVGDGLTIQGGVLSTANKITCSTEDLTPGESHLANGELYIVYE